MLYLLFQLFPFLLLIKQIINEMMRVVIKHKKIAFMTMIPIQMGDSFGVYSFLETFLGETKLFK